METTVMEMKKKGILICKLKPCKNASSENKLQFCEKHLQIYREFLAKNPCLLTPKKSQLVGIEYPFTINREKEKEIVEKELPPEDLRCCIHNGVGNRCEKVRMWVDAEDDTSVLNTKHCRKHYNYHVDRRAKIKKKGSGDGCTTNCSNKRRKKAVAEDETGIRLPATISGKSNSDNIVEGGSANIGTKRKNVERTEFSGELESLTRTRDPVAELESLEHYKSECVRLSVELEKKKLECTTLKGKLAEVGTECTTLKGKLAEVDTKMTVVKEDTERTLADATECWRKMFSDLESRVVLKMEHVYSAMGCIESRFSMLESLVLSSAKKSSILRCVELQSSEKIESEAQDLLNNVTQTGDKQRDKNSRIKLTASTSSEENVPNVSDIGVNKHHAAELEIPKYSAMNNFSGSLHLSSGGENVEEGKGRVCSEERPSQHHLEISFLNSVSDDDGESSRESFPEDSDSSSDSTGSLGDLMDMLAMKYKNKKKNKEIKWELEADMHSSFEDDPELCMKAVCALYRQHLSGYEVSAKGLFYYSEVLRFTTLAKFLMDEDCKGDLKKSVEELEIFDSDGVEDCKMLAKRYSK